MNEVERLSGRECVPNKEASAHGYSPVCWGRGIQRRASEIDHRCSFLAKNMNLRFFSLRTFELHTDNSFTSHLSFLPNLDLDDPASVDLVFAGNEPKSPTLRFETNRLCSLFTISPTHLKKKKSTEKPYNIAIFFSEAGRYLQNILIVVNGRGKPPVLSCDRSLSRGEGVVCRCSIYAKFVIRLSVIHQC
jgi:hypothetical protein